MKKIKTKILKKIKILQIFDGLINYKKIKSTIKLVYKQQYINGKNYLGINNFKTLKKTLISFLLHEPQNYEVVNSFLNAKIKIIKENYNFSKISKDDVILVCLIKDDITRLKQIFEYYRNIGIEYFCFIDNNSSDGTLEYLLNQKDTNVYYTDEQYTTKNREGWLNRIYNYIGYNKWILCIDSDELYTYCNMEEHKIKEYIKMLEVNKIKRTRSLLLDMYSKEDLFSDKNSNNFSEINYFDIDGYENVESHRCYFITGGPRKRVFSTKDEILNCTISKYPLFFYEEGDFQGSSHWSFPYNKNRKEICAVLRHYKFMKDDFGKYKQRVINGNYANGSVEYKKYIETIKKKKKINFFCNRTVKYTSSFDLLKINVSQDKLENYFNIQGE